MCSVVNTVCVCVREWAYVGLWPSSGVGTGARPCSLRRWGAEGRDVWPPRGLQTGCAMCMCFARMHPARVCALHVRCALWVGCLERRARVCVGAAGLLPAGRVGIYYGCRLGHKVPWCTQFPFGTVPHPQYVGSSLSILGVAVMIWSEAAVAAGLPILLAVWIGSYIVSGYLEQNM
jgi:hypothetical protein